MSRLAELSPELEELLAAACRDDASPAELQALERAADDPRSMRLLADYLQLNTDLQWLVRRQANADKCLAMLDAPLHDAAPLAPRIAPADAPLVVPVILPVAPTPSYFLRGELMFSYVAASVILAAMLLGAWSYTITHPAADTYANNSRGATSSSATDPSQFIFVGRVSGMVDCLWSNEATATSPGAGVALNRRYALKSGLMEITYDSGAKVILQGPCDYTVESPRGGFLQMGKLVARVGEGSGVRGQGSGTNLPSPIGRGAGGEGFGPHSQPALTLALSGHHEVVGERGRNPESPNSRTPNPKSPTPHAPRPTPLFAVRTPTALVEDLGTEFGVEVAESGETASHVFQGQVRVRLDGAGNGGRGAGDENPESRIQNPEILLSAGQSARVERDMKSGQLSISSTERVAAPMQFIRRLTAAARFIDLVDIVAGGNGFSGLRNYGIDPGSGRRANSAAPDLRIEGDGQYHLVSESPYIDGVFIPDGRNTAVQVDSAGRRFSDFPPTANETANYIWAGGKISRTATSSNDTIPARLMDVDYSLPAHGVLFLHANKGITFDLDAIRQANRGYRLARFCAMAGNTAMPDNSPDAIWPPAADLWVIVDGQARFIRKGINGRSGGHAVSVSLADTERFLTLAATDGGDGIEWDWTMFCDPRLELVPNAAENMPQGSERRKNP